MLVATRCIESRLSIERVATVNPASDFPSLFALKSSTPEWRVKWLAKQPTSISQDGWVDPRFLSGNWLL